MATAGSGHAPNAPYDSIIAAAGGDELPPAWLEQLADGGRLVAPMQGARGGGQVLVVVDRQGDEFRRSMHEAVHFVPSKIRHRIGRTFRHAVCDARQAGLGWLLAAWSSLVLAGCASSGRKAPVEDRSTAAPSRTAAAPRRRRRRRPSRQPSRCPAPRTPASRATTPSSPATR